MFKKALIAGVIAVAATVPGSLLAADAEPAKPDAAPAEAKSPHSFTANVGLYSQYIFRGLTQTNRDPAIQGGFDYAYDTGGPTLYVGTWGSNSSGLHEATPQQYSSSSLENDWYVGVRGNFGKSDFTYDAGFLYYYYPGTVAPGGEKADTQELYGALGWKWFTAKWSYGVGSKTFAVRDSSGTWYLDLTANYPVGETGLNLIAHWGDQKFKGTDPRNVFGGVLRSNDSVYSYKDWKVGATYDLGKMTDVLKSVTLGGYYTKANVNTLGYGNVGQGGPYPRNLGDGTFTVYVQKTF